MQQFSEINIELRPAIKRRRKKKETKDQKTEKTRVPYKNKQTTLDEHKKKNIKQHYLNSTKLSTICYKISFLWCLLKKFKENKLFNFFWLKS